MSKKSPKLVPFPGPGCIHLVNNKHQCTLLNIGIHPFCVKLYSNPCQEDDEIIKYYTCPSYGVIEGGKYM